MRKEEIIDVIPIFGPLIGVAMFLTACALPALTFSSHWSGTWSGSKCLGYTLFAPLCLHFELAANSLFLISLIMLATRSAKPALITSGLAAIVALQTLTMFNYSVPDPDNLHSKICLARLEPGFYLWVGSMLFTFIISAVWKRFSVAPKSTPD